MLHASPSLSHQRAVVELLFGAVLWGGSFVASKYALEAMGPLHLISSRYILAVLVVVPVFLLSPQLRKSLTLEQFSLAMLPGMFLSITLVLSVAGLQYTTVTKNSFITVLYVLFVPLLDPPVFGRRVHWSQAVWVGLALVGAALICQLEAGTWNRGDLLTLVSALTATAHILTLELIAHRIQSPFTFNVFQSFWAGLLPSLLVPIDSIKQWPLPPTAVASIVLLSIGVTLIAFLIQIRAQRVLPSSTVSMLFLIESPMAAAFAFLAFGETPTVLQAIGAALILGAAYGSTRRAI